MDMLTSSSSGFWWKVGTWMDVFSKETFSWLEQMLICYLRYYHAEEKPTLTTFLLKENPQKHDEQFSATWWRWHVDDPKAPMGHSEGISSVVEIWSKWIRKGLMNTFTFMTWKRQRSPVCVWWKRCGKAMFKMRIFLPLLVVTNSWWILDLDWFNGLRKACENQDLLTKIRSMWYHVISRQSEIPWREKPRSCSPQTWRCSNWFPALALRLDVDRH